MNISDEVPAKWHPYFKVANFESFRDVAAVAKVSPTTVIACLVPGVRMPKDPTVEKVASALRMTSEKLRELRGDPVVEPFTLPRDADILGSTERRAVAEVVRTFTQAHDRERETRRRFDDLNELVSARIFQSLGAAKDIYEWLISLGLPDEEVTPKVLSIMNPLIVDALPAIATEMQGSVEAHQAELDELRRAVGSTSSNKPKTSAIAAAAAVAADRVIAEQSKDTSNKSV